MEFQLKFHPAALSEWRQLDKTLRVHFKKQLARRLINPKVESARLAGKLHNCFKIKHSSSGYRLIYQVSEDDQVFLVLAIGKRERLEVYDIAERRNR